MRTALLLAALALTAACNPLRVAGDVAVGTTQFGLGATRAAVGAVGAVDAAL